MRQGFANRIESLDWLRGLMAIAIMFYHLTSWHITPLDSSSVLGRLGIYGVSVFFILSGLSMAVVYSNFIVDSKTAISFFIRRIFRIWPLLWICIALSTIPSLIKGSEISTTLILINMTTLFGFFSPESYINTGAWSLGNEMVYYAFTPFILRCYEKRKIQGNLIFSLSLAIALLFAFVFLDPNKNMGDQWKIYINPFNSLFLYISGIAIYYNLKDVKINPEVVAILFFSSILAFILYPATGDQIAIITGGNRMAFSLASIVLVTAFYKLSDCHFIPKTIRQPLNALGIATYGIYILHPIVNNYINHAFDFIGVQSHLLKITLVIIITPIIAIISYNVFEMKMMQLGKFITVKYIGRYTQSTERAGI